MKPGESYFLMTLDQKTKIISADQIDHYEKCMLFLHFISSFEGASYKNVKDAASYQFFYLLLFYVSFSFASADIIFHKFLELDSELSGKKNCYNFSFLTDSFKLPHPLNG